MRLRRRYINSSVLRVGGEPFEERPRAADSMRDHEGVAVGRKIVGPGKTPPKATCGLGRC